MSHHASWGLEKDSSSLCECRARQNDDDKLWSKQKKNKELASCVWSFKPCLFQPRVPRKTELKQRLELSALAIPFFKILIFYETFIVVGELAQMVERPLRMREVPGSMPGFSNLITSKIIFFFCLATHNIQTLNPAIGKGRLGSFHPSQTLCYEARR